MSDEKHLPIYDEIAADVGDLVQAWTTFKALSMNKRYVDLANRASPHFFGGIQAALRGYAVTILARLLEGPVVAGKKTASLEVLLNLMDLDDQKRRELLLGLTALRTQAKPVVAYRHKWIAHTDYEQRAGEIDRRSPRIEEVDTALRLLLDLIERIERAAKLQEIPYENSAGERDVEQLMMLLERALPSA